MRKKAPRPKLWKKHKQESVDLGCGVRVEVDKSIVHLIKMLNHAGMETRHSCEGRKPGRGYVSMFATHQALGLAHYLIQHGSVARVVIERDIHPYGYDNLTIRWPKKNYKIFERLIHEYFYGKY